MAQRGIVRQMNPTSLSPARSYGEGSTALRFAHTGETFEDIIKAKRSTVGSCGTEHARKERPRHSKRTKVEKGWYSERLNQTDFAANRTNAYDGDSGNILLFIPAEYRP